eukprot:1407598-Lingulodinium_polyedra.AAC.1
MDPNRSSRPSLAMPVASIYGKWTTARATRSCSPTASCPAKDRGPWPLRATWPPRVLQTFIAAQ